MLPYLATFVVLTGLIWAAMEWIYRRELHYLRECLRLQSVRLVTYWPGMESWRLASEALAGERAAAAREIVPAAAEWREPEILPVSMPTGVELKEPLNVVNITAGLVAGLAESQTARARVAVSNEAARSRANESLAQARPRRKSARMRRAAN